MLSVNSFTNNNMVPLFNQSYSYVDKSIAPLNSPKTPRHIPSTEQLLENTLHTSECHIKDLSYLIKCMKHYFTFSCNITT